MDPSGNLFFYIILALLLIVIVLYPHLLFYYVLAIFLLKIVMNLYMSVFILAAGAGLIKHEGRISLALPGAEIILIPVLTLTAFFSETGHWWARPLTIFSLSLALTVFSYGLAFAYKFTGRWRNHNLKHKP